jgi:hypothetical protein
MMGCTLWPGPSLHLKDNPFDQALRDSGLVDSVPGFAREQLLKRFPIGSPTAGLRQYLESIGAACERKSVGPIVCRYSSYVLFRQQGVLGDEWRRFMYYDFTTRVWPGQGPIAKLTVCDAGVSEVQRGPGLIGDHPYERKSEFIPCVQYQDERK